MWLAERLLAQRAGWLPAERARTVCNALLNALTAWPTAYRRERPPSATVERRGATRWACCLCAALCAAGVPPKSPSPPVVSWLSLAADVAPLEAAWAARGAEASPPRFDARTLTRAHVRAPRDLGPFVSCDGFRALADVIVCDAPAGCRPNARGLWAAIARALPPHRAAVVVYVRTDYQGEFAARHWPEVRRSRVPVVLLTHATDRGAPLARPIGRGAGARWPGGGGRRGTTDPAALLGDPLLVRWFGQNVRAAHPKLVPVPIGVPYPAADPAVVARSLAALVAARRAAAGGPPPNRTLLCNFGTATWPGRLRLARLCASWIWATSAVSARHGGRLAPADFYAQVAAHRFVAAPRGNGLDSFRTWLALYVGRVPVVVSSHMDAAFAGLPVLILPSEAAWAGLTEAYLDEQWGALMGVAGGGGGGAGRWDPRRLHMSAWACDVAAAAGYAVPAGDGDGASGQLCTLRDESVAAPAGGRRRGGGGRRWPPFRDVNARLWGS